MVMHFGLSNLTARLAYQEFPGIRCP